MADNDQVAAIARSRAEWASLRRRLETVTPAMLARAGLTVGAGEVLAEVFEVAAEVEYEEVLLVITGREQVRTQPGATADHLPELRCGPDELEEDEVDDLGDVDSGVEHVDGDRDVWCLLCGGEVVDQ